MAHPSAQTRTKVPVDLYRCVGGGHEHEGAYPDVVDAKRRARIDFRAGRPGRYLAVACATGRAVEEFEVVGNPQLTCSPDTVRLWPHDAELAFNLARCGVLLRPDGTDGGTDPSGPASQAEAA